MRALVLGPQGVVGDAILRAAVRDDRVATVIAVSRRPLTYEHPKLTVAIHRDFTNFAPLEGALTAVDVVLCALGISWYQVASDPGREAAYRRITHDYVMACARVVSVANPAVRFCFVSGHGASPTSAQAWARIKAETEKDLQSIFGARLTVFRPGYVYPVRGRETPYWGDAVMRPFMPLRAVMSRWITDSDEVARAVLHAATGGSVSSPAENRAIIAAAAAYGVSAREASRTSARTSR
jgi:nucleoside-diphosphate-sugar epimerase